jgi:Zn-dependent oligopeptidase
LRKTLEDALSEMSVVTLAATLPSTKRRPWMKNITSNTANKLNTEKIKPSHLLKTYKDYVKSEVWGALDGYQQILAEALSRLVRITGCNTLPTDTERQDSGKLLRNFIGSLYQHDKLKNEIPQLHIGASLHALVRYDQQRKYKPNDLEDFRHAGAALPYCDHFLTEKSLAHMICRPPAKLEAEYQCVVATNPGQAIDHLSEN